MKVGICELKYHIETLLYSKIDKGMPLVMNNWRIEIKNVKLMRGYMLVYLFF